MKPEDALPSGARVEGLTRAEWTARLRMEGHDDTEARFIVAITFGDVINADEWPDLADE